MLNKKKSTLQQLLEVAQQMLLHEKKELIKKVENMNKIKNVRNKKKH